VRQSGVVEGKRETPLGPRVHVFVFAVTGVHAENVTVIADPLGIRRRTAERFGPVGRQPLYVLRMEIEVRKRVTDYRIFQAAVMPRSGQIEQSLTAAGGLEDRRLHRDILAGRGRHWQSVEPAPQKVRSAVGSPTPEM
jgi:hypothetical protein